MIDRSIIDELVELRRSARLAAGDYSEAISAQAEKANVNKGALRRYINAREKDNLSGLADEQSALENLMETMK